MYAYAGNNPVRYTDPDGRVYTRKSAVSDEVFINEQTVIGKSLDSLLSGLAPIFGEKYVDFIYKTGGEQRINTKKDSAISTSVGVISFFSNVDYPAEISKIGKSASFISRISTAISIIGNFKDVKLIATENLTCKIFGEYIKSKDHNITANLFKYAYKRMQYFITFGYVSMEYNRIGNIKSYNIDNELAITMVINELNILKMELECE